MKKYIFGLAALALMVTSCDPIKSEVKPVDALSANDFKVVATPKSQNNNNFTVTTNPARYFVLYSSFDGENWEKQGSGVKVAVQTAPPAGEIRFYAETLLSDGTLVKSPVTDPIAYSEFTDLPELYKDLFNFDPATGNYNAATFEFNKTSNFVYGAGSYLDPGQTIKTGPWWGVTLGELAEADWKMDMSLAGISVFKPNDDGGWDEVNKGGLKVTIDPIAVDVNGGNWNVGNLTLGCPVIHGQGDWGEGDFLDYQVMDASNGELFLGHPDDGFAGGAWSTCWFWWFTKK